MAEKAADSRVPVTVLTGFLGSGKTTLLNHILTATHGKKIAVIENEFGEVGIDDKLLASNSKYQLEEELFEMMNGCICCTVRQDLVETLHKLADRAANGLKLDGIVIETTGLADPSPVAQSFFVDEQVQKFAKLDGIVTLVDAKHIVQHLDDDKKPDGAVNEAVEQVAFADRLLLNKVDLVPDPADLEDIEDRLRSINKFAPIIRCQQATVSVENVLNIQGFSLDRVLDMDPEFLKEEDEHGHSHGHGHGEGHGHGHACDENCEEHSHGHGHGHSEGHGHGHTCDEHCEEHGHGHGHGHKHKHEHDYNVKSVSIVQPGEVDLQDIQEWIGNMLENKGNDIFRMKGVIAIDGADQKFVYQGVHMIFSGDFSDPWGEDEPRKSHLVFIGRNLDKTELETAFLECLATPEKKQAKLSKLRFKVGDGVKCNTGSAEWSKGQVVALMYREKGMPPGMFAPYQVKLNDGALIFAPMDDDRVICKA